MRWFRHCDRRWAFLWEDAAQPPARWHGENEGPVQYLADTPDGAWAEFIRHEEITDAADLAGVERSLWAVEIDLEDEEIQAPDLPEEILKGGLDSYSACRDEARRLRGDGASGLEAPSAALVEGGARGFVVHGGLVDAPDRPGNALVLFGARPEVCGWQCVAQGSPPDRVVDLVRPLTA
jgi:RES domain